MDRTEVYHILGTDGHLRVLDAFAPGTEEQVIEQFDPEDNLTPHTVAGADQYQLMVEHFADCVLNDKDVRFGPADAALNMAVIEALLKSARNEGAIVSVEG
jgi:predicted dehydrogenase